MSFSTNTGRAPLLLAPTEVDRLLSTGTVRRGACRPLSTGAGPSGPNPLLSGWLATSCAARTGATLRTNSTSSSPNVKRVPSLLNSSRGFRLVALCMDCRNAVPKLQWSATSLHTVALLLKVLEIPGILRLKGLVMPTFSSVAPPLAVPTFFPGNSFSNDRPSSFMSSSLIRMPCLTV